MHFAITYDLSLEGQERSKVEGFIETILHPFKHVKILTTFYIVHIDKLDEWIIIRNHLQELCNDLKGPLHFIMTPTMTGGFYDGYLISSEWNGINAITQQDSHEHDK